MPCLSLLNGDLYTLHSPDGDPVRTRQEQQELPLVLFRQVPATEKQNKKLIDSSSYCYCKNKHEKQQVWLSENTKKIKNISTNPKFSLVRHTVLVPSTKQRQLCPYWPEDLPEMLNGWMVGSVSLLVLAVLLQQLPVVVLITYHQGHQLLYNTHGIKQTIFIILRWHENEYFF